MRRCGDVEPSNWTVAVEHRVQENNWDRYGDTVIRADATRCDRVLLEKERATVVVVAFDFLAGGLVLVASPMLVHDCGRMCMLMIGSDMDMKRRQQ